MTEQTPAFDGADGPEVVVAGYASIDFAFRASAPPAVGRTALLRGAADAPPRFGGCGPNAAREIARLGRRVGLVSWLGDDVSGRAYLAALAGEGVDARGVVVAGGCPSPRCYLFYDPDGGAACYYHPSGSAELRLTDGARAMVASARALALAVGPAPLTEALLDARPPGVPVAWSVKADPDAYPAALRSRLIREADIVCLNREELPFVASALLGPRPRDETEAVAALRRDGDTVVVVTAGAEGCRVSWPGGDAAVPAEEVAVADPTGAGDAFFGAFVAAWIGGAAPPEAARAAASRVAAMLQVRAEAGGLE